MLSYTQRRNLYGDYTSDSSTENLSFGDTVMNESEKRVINKRAWDFTQRTFADTTVASQQFYNLPVNYRRLIGNPTVTVGGTTYTPTEVPDRTSWDRLNSTSSTSDIPQYFFIFNKQIGFYPKPTSSGNTISIPYELQSRKLSVADFTTGTIVSIANGATTVTGTGTSWTDGMAGRYIQITEDNTADSGDNQWYEVASITGGTILELSIPYEGTTIAAATQGYTLAQMSVLPDGYDMLPVYEASQQYFIKTLEAGKADRYGELYDDLMLDLTKDHGQKSSSVVVEQVGMIKNPNLYLTK